MVTDVAESKQSFAERLGQWLDFADALTLFSALNAGGEDASAPRSAAFSPEAAGAREAFVRVRRVLMDSITASAEPELTEGTPDFAPFHRYYLARQRDMGARIAPLRENVRGALSRQSPALKRLAGLDAVLDQALAARERDLLATVPGHLAGRFERLYEAHRATVAETPATDDPQRWMQPGGWLAMFRRDMQAVLLAELEVRLQPVAGLVAALENEATGKQ